MKTTIEISDALGLEARAAARARKTTLRALVERGLRLALDETESDVSAYEPVVYGEGGLRPEFEGRRWEAFAAAIYEDDAT